MSKYYTPKRARNLYQPGASEPYKLSRSKIELFLNCPCCFYLDRRLGIGQPPGYPFTLNAAVDKLLKKEFDIKIIPYTGDDSWVEQVIQGAHKCLMSETIPEPGDDCDFCKYRNAVREFEREI